MTVALTNAQRGVPVDVPRLTRLARLAVRALRIRTPGRLEITLVDPQQMRRLNRRFLRHDRLTDVLSFRYPEGQGTVGDILVAPSAARRYARANDLSYVKELSRYVLHGLLHWKGYDDTTPTQQRRMRALEDHLLARYCRNGTVSL